MVSLINVYWLLFCSCTQHWKTSERQKQTLSIGGQRGDQPVLLMASRNIIIHSMETKSSASGFDVSRSAVTFQGLPVKLFPLRDIPTGNIWAELVHNMRIVLVFAFSFLLENKPPNQSYLETRKCIFLHVGKFPKHSWASHCVGWGGPWLGAGVSKWLILKKSGTKIGESIFKEGGGTTMVQTDTMFGLCYSLLDYNWGKIQIMRYSTVATLCKLVMGWASVSH